MEHVEAIRWDQDQLWLLDQRVLPDEESWIAYSGAVETACAITDMVVRGAPAIGVTAAYGVVLAARSAYANSASEWKQSIRADLSTLANSRPTAVNLFWALERMERCIEKLDNETCPEAALLAEAKAIHDEDQKSNQAMGRLGAKLILGDAKDKVTVLTHCNTGTLATGGYGTALGVIRSLYSGGRLEKVYADETRPWLQGARLTAWELEKDGIPVVLNVDSAAAHIMKTQNIDWVIVGADRITANGDTANKIGTYSLAVLAKHHGVRFMVVAPSSTVDLSLSDGSCIPIEERDSAELTSIAGKDIAPRGIGGFNPVFDVTPHELIDVIVTEKGVVEKPDTEQMRSVLGS